MRAELICNLYGDGFYYIPGTNICLKLGGYARAQFYGFTGQNATAGPFFAPNNKRPRPVQPERHRHRLVRLDHPQPRGDHGRYPRADRLRRLAHLLPDRMRCDLFTGTSITAQSRCSSTSLLPCLDWKYSRAASS